MQMSLLITTPPLQEISKDFDRNYNDLIGNFKEQLQAQYH